MSQNNTPQKAKRGPNHETRKRPGDLKPWKLNEKKELIISTVRGFFCAIPHYNEDGALEFCGADTEYINEYKLREHIQEHHIERKQEPIKLAAEVKRPENAPAKKKWTFLTPTYHPYRRNHNRQSSIAPSVGQPQSREISVAVDYSTWGFGDSITPMAMRTYGQAATNTIAYPAQALIAGSGSSISTPYTQYNISTLPGPPSYNPRATPEQLSAELLARLQQVKGMTPQELSENMQKHFPGFPIYPPLDPRFAGMSGLFKNAQTATNLNPSANTSNPAALSFNLLTNTMNPSLIDNAQTGPILDPSLIVQQPHSASAMIFGAYSNQSYGNHFPLLPTSLPSTGYQVGPLAPQPLSQFQSAQYSPFAHHGLRQGHIQEFLAQVEQNSPFRDPFPGEEFHPEGWVISAHRRAARWGWGYPAGSTVVRMSGGIIAVVAPGPHGQSGDNDEVVLASVEHDEERGQGGEEAGELEEGEVGEREMDMDERSK